MESRAKPVDDAISLAVFLKEPIPGRVKTRLAADIGGERAAELYRAFVEDTLECLSRWRGAETSLFYSPRGAEAACRELTPQGSIRRGSRAFRLRPQSEGDLGMRLASAIDELHSETPHRPIIAMGTDCPLLDRRILALAAEGLRDHDVVIGPARDGGYYLIGLQRPRAHLFRNIAWSTQSVLEETLRKARQARLSSLLLPSLGDVDTMDDLRTLHRELLEAWRDATLGRRLDFPCRTFRYIEWLRPV